MNKYSAKSGIFLFKLFDFEVRLDFSWFILGLLITWTLAAFYFPINFKGLTPTTYWIMGACGAIGLLFSIIFHEFCHSLVGRHYGLSIAGIKLFIFGGVAEMHNEPPSPKAEFFMSIAGPLSSLVLAGMFALIYQLGLGKGLPLAVEGVISYLSVINLVLAIFNLLPGFPLDGGRVLRSLLWWWKDDLIWATHYASKIGVGVGYGLILLGVLLFIEGALISGLWMFLIGFFLQRMSQVSYQNLLIKETFHSEVVRKYATTNPVTVPPNINLRELIDTYFYQHFHKLYPVTENDQLLGYISFEIIKDYPKEKWDELTIREVMKAITAEIAVDLNTKVIDVLQIMYAKNRSRLIVTENKKLYGVITLKDIMDVVAIKNQF